MKKESNTKRQSFKLQNIETLQVEIFNSVCTGHYDVDCF